jgi:hypothetical protein
VTERDGIQTAFGRLAADQPVEAIFREHLGNRANPIRPFGMPRWGQVVEACRMRQE